MFIPISWSRVPKTLVIFLSDKGARSIFFSNIWSLTLIADKRGPKTLGVSDVRKNVFLFADLQTGGLGTLDSFRMRDGHQKAKASES